MLRFLILFCCSLFLTACSNFDYSTNLDKENFDEYFKPSQVTVYEKDQLDDLDYQFIRAVEGSSCQEEPNDRPADIKVARTNARIHAANIDANGIVFQSCISFPEDKSCITNIICYAQALDVSFPVEE
ncbi:MAG: Rcs stress response system protein RcsF [Psychromonas sp.]